MAKNKRQFIPNSDMAKVKKMVPYEKYQKENLNKAFMYLANLNPVMDFYAVGIDIGADGGLTIMEVTGGNITGCTTEGMPYEYKTKNYPVVEIYDFIKSRIKMDRPVHFVMEAVHSFPGQGVKSMFSFGRALGIIQSIVEVLRSEVIRAGHKSEVFSINPKLWTGYYFPEGLPKDKGEKKAMYFAKALELYPQLESRLMRKSGVAFHSGKVDSLLMCEFLRRALLKDSCFFLVMREGVKYVRRGLLKDEYILANLDTIYQVAETYMIKLAYKNEWLTKKRKRAFKKELKEVRKMVEKLIWIRSHYNEFKYYVERLCTPDTGGRTGVWLSYEDCCD